MRVEVKMPRMGQSMEEGTLLSWLKPVGAIVKAGDPLVEIETDKATVEIEAFSNGTLVEVLVQVGDTVPVGSILGYIEDHRAEKSPTSAATTPSPASTSTHMPHRSTSTPVTPMRVNASPVVKRLAKEHAFDLNAVSGTGPDGRIIKRDIDALLQTPTAPSAKSGRVDISPVARRLAKEHALILDTIRGTGPGGRIIKRDIEAQLAAPSQAAAQSPAPMTTAAGERQPLSKIKRATARLMTQSKTTIPHFYVSIDVEMGQALALRQSLKRRGHSLSVNHLILKAAAITLADYPNLNAVLDGDAIVMQPHINIATAVALMENDRPTGLITPVVHRCETLSLVELAQAADTVIERARSGQLRGRDLTDGTFTVSNLGMFGVKHFEAIVNPPQVAILAVGTIQRIVTFDAQDNVVPAQLMTATLSADHRVTDGAEVASFMRDFKLILEDGFALLMD